MKIDFDATVPIYLQIIEEIQRQIVSGERLPGEKVESVRELAQSMGVNPNTVQRAFAELERGGMLYTERTSGRFITSDETLIRKIREESARKLIRSFIGQMLKSGFSREDILRLVTAYLGDEEHG